LDAEIMSLVGMSKSNEAVCRKKYESAIFMAGRRGCFQDHALAQELYAAFCLRTGDTEDALYHTQRSMQIYEEWGAKRIASLRRINHGNISGMSFVLPHQQQELAETSILSWQSNESNP
jgi:hypothetical protein